MMLMCNYSDLSDETSRKFVKTCVEKKRRDRINKSLDELKDLISSTDERIRCQKLEKAEILEMTVDYIRNLHQSMNEYEHGYKHCYDEIWKLIHSTPNIHSEQRQYLADHCQQLWIHRRWKQVDSSECSTIEEKYLQIIIENSSNLSPPKLWKPYM